ncbi:50S ribosomal protein L15, variant [Fonticula alba]|uniref:50S ribosomal protein L15, variant n=1 Tax=Fonticula alba TaxID=691883 RepID=A0A058Z644_FONAL|nr:50S ribosomal protein L15, variant [Fonticula alba]KCV69745.1 50S ribosomal protein L15, variant [Fonticula alba]|eukprot:XP_009496310.1 50S ribosomal protein L15, variant [Fonticula alba]
MISLSALCRMTASASLRSAGGAPSAAFSSAARQATLAGTISLNNIADNPGSSRAFKRVGRGHGSGLGKTSGRGHKGQNARSGNGKTSPWFEGGQSTIIAKTPKTGFNNAAFRKDFVELNLAQLQHFINIGRINPHEPITIKTLYESGVVHGVKDGVKLLADGRDLFYSKVDIQVSKGAHLARRPCWVAFFLLSFPPPPPPGVATRLTLPSLLLSSPFFGDRAGRSSCSLRAGH